MQATDRPPDKVTSDWCSDIVFKPDGELAQFIVWAPTIPLKVGRLIMSGDPDSAYRGTYSMQITFEQPFSMTLSESCLTSQGIKLACPVLGRQIGQFLAPEANIYAVRCYDPPPGQGGCQCDYDLSFIGGPNGRWYTGQNSTTINFFDDSFAPPATSDYCLGASGSLDLTGHRLHRALQREVDENDAFSAAVVQRWRAQPLARRDGRRLRRTHLSTVRHVLRRYQERRRDGHRLRRLVPRCAL